MNIDQKNIDMTIEYDLSKPILVRQLTLGKIVTWKFPTEEIHPFLQLPEEVTRPVLEYQVSADIDWKAYPYNLSFPPDAKL